MTMRKRWWILGAMGVATAALGVFGTVWWHSTPDLDAVVERMRHLGLPTTLDEVRDREFRDGSETSLLVALDETAKTFDLDAVFANTEGLDGDVWERTHPQDIHSEPLWGMVRAHAHLAMMQLRSGADALPGRPVRSGTPTGLYQGEEVFAGFSAVAALTLLSAGESDPEPDLVRAMRVIAAQPLHVSLISGANAQRSRRTVLLTIAGRWRDVHPEGRLMFEVESWRHPDPRTLVAAAHELRVLVSAWRDLSAMEIHKTFNVGLVSYHWFDEYVTHPWAARCGRSGALLLSAELIARGATTAECADAWQRSYAAGRNRWAMLRDPVGHALTFGPIPLMHVIRLQETKNQIFAALLVALIRGEPIPVDPTDPAGKPLRRYERNGELIGYYACGDDGVDDGGTTDDWRFPFDRPWDPPASP